MNSIERGFYEEIKTRSEVSTQEVFEYLKRLILKQEDESLLKKAGFDLFIDFDRSDRSLVVSATFEAHKNDGLTVCLLKNADKDSFKDESSVLELIKNGSDFILILRSFINYVLFDESYYNKLIEDKEEEKALNEIKNTYQPYFNGYCNADQIDCFYDVYEAAKRYIRERLDSEIYDCYLDIEEEVGLNYLMMHVNHENIDYNFKILDNMEMPCVPSNKTLLKMFKEVEENIQRIVTVINNKYNEQFSDIEEVTTYNALEMIDCGVSLEQGIIEYFKSKFSEEEETGICYYFANLDRYNTEKEGSFTIEVNGTSLEIELNNEVDSRKELISLFKEIDNIICIVKKLI